MDTSPGRAGGEGHCGGCRPSIRTYVHGSSHRCARPNPRMGRVTYEQMAAHWPTATDEYAAFINNLPKVVFSKRSNRRMDQLRIAHGDPHRGDNRPQERIRRRHLRPWRCHVRPGAIQARPDRRVPSRHPPGRPGRRAAAVQGPGQAATTGPRRSQELSRRVGHPRLPVAFLGVADDGQGRGEPQEQRPRRDSLAARAAAATGRACGARNRTDGGRDENLRLRPPPPGRRSAWRWPTGHGRRCRRPVPRRQPRTTIA